MSFFEAVRFWFVDPTTGNLTTSRRQPTKANYNLDPDLGEQSVKYPLFIAVNETQRLDLTPSGSLP